MSLFSVPLKMQQYAVLRNWLLSFSKCLTECDEVFLEALNVTLASVFEG